MADLTSRKNAVDERSAKIRLRRMEHEVYSLKGSIGKFEIDILEAEASIERLHESIETTNTRISEKEAELAEQAAALNEKEG